MLAQSVTYLGDIGSSDPIASTKYTMLKQVNCWETEHTSLGLNPTLRVTALHLGV